MKDLERYGRDQETQVFQNLDEKESLHAQGVTEDFVKVAASVGYTLDDLCELLESGRTVAGVTQMIFDKVRTPGERGENRP